MAIKKGQFQFVNVLLEQVIKRHSEVQIVSSFPDSDFLQAIHYFQYCFCILVLC